MGTAQKLPQVTPITISDNLLYVNVQINGRGPYAFIIDSNTPDVCRLDFHVARDLKLNIIGYQQVSSGVSVRREFQVQVDRLELGQVAFHNLKVIVSEFNATPKQLHIDGVIGRDFFANYLLKIDGPARQLILSKEQLMAQEPGVLSYTKVLLITAKLGSRAVPLSLTTGSDVAFQFPTAALTGSRYTNTANTLTLTNSGVSYTLQEASLQNDMWIGTVKITEPLIHYSDRVHQIIGGEAFLKDHILTLDQRNRLLRLD